MANDRLPTAVVVDGYSVANHLPAAFRRKGCRVVHVQSGERLLTTLQAPDLDNYAHNIVAGGDWRDVQAQLLDWNPVCVVAGSEPGVILADQLSQALGLPTNGTALSTARRNKYDMIEALRSAGIRSCVQHRSGCPDELAQWASDNLDWPVVVKPMSSACADGVHFCDNADEVARAAKEILATLDLFGQPNNEVLVQACLQGTEYLVDTVSYAGNAYVCGVWRYEKTLLANGRKLYDKDILMDPAEDPAPELIAYIRSVLDALDIRYGPGHAEVMMTADGPVLVEIAARPDGNLHPAFHDHCLGGNQADLMALAYTQPAEFLAEYGGRAYTKVRDAVMCSAPTTLDGTVTAIDDAVLREMTALPTVYEVGVKRGPGDRIVPTIDLASSPINFFLAGERYDDILRDYGVLQVLKDRLFKLS